MNIAIFCAANGSLDAVYYEKTRQLGRWMAENGHTLVFGGCDVGLMGCVAHAVNDAGGKCIGVVPQILLNNPLRPIPKLERLVECDDMSQRKDQLIALSDCIVALPGGVGTIDEVFTVVAQASVGYHHRSVLLYNINGFWNALRSMLEEMESRGVLRTGWKEQLVFVNDFESLTRLISAQEPKHDACLR